MVPYLKQYSKESLSKLQPLINEMSVSELEPLHITYLLKGSDSLEISHEAMNDLML
jgi:hypothetical protein